MEWTKFDIIMGFLVTVMVAIFITIALNISKTNTREIKQTFLECVEKTEDAKWCYDKIK